VAVDQTFRVASDVGGTFTDSIAYDSATQRITVSKVSTTPENRAVGTSHGLKQALAQQGAAGAAVSYVGHGMTTATNAVIQRTGARTAFLTNAGFRDLLEIGRQNRPTLFDITVVRPAQLAPRELCFTSRGRIGPSGEEIEPLSEEDVRVAGAEMAAAGVESVAILFLHSYANPAHEARARAILEETLPGVPVCASTDISLEFREYERASTTVLNAYLRPVMETYLATLSQILQYRKAGLGLDPARPVMVMDAAGGLMSLDNAREKPVHTVLSGPAGGVVAAAHVAANAGISDIITMDIGGTSTDISLIREGKPEVTRTASLETVPIQLPVIDINAIGAGGGSIAWIDAGGALRVGPMSAEAAPVISRDIAEPLGYTLERAAAGILSVAHANIVRGIRVVSVERGYDPRDFALVPFGGAGPMHGSPVARELKMPRVLVPPTPGILCALGQLISDLRHDFVETHVAPLEALGVEGARLQIKGLVDRARAHLERDGIAENRREIEIRIDLRYVGQSFALPIETDPAAPGWWEALPEAFNATHLARFGHADPETPLEVVGFSVTGIGRIEKPRLPRLAAGATAPTEAALRGVRRMYFEPGDAGDEGEWREARIWSRDGLFAGNVVEGPAAIEEISATTILYPNDRASVLPCGNILVEVAM
jgi:N-methylhydantoinase A